jgi:Leucine-rich repeat (LRR) protein
MVYSENISEDMPANNMAERAARGVKLLGAGVVKVVHRCDDAKESKILDLSSCSLTQVPDAVYFLMRASDDLAQDDPFRHKNEIQKCNLSTNLITKIPPKFGFCFQQLSTLNLSGNRISILPGELIHCSQLQSVDISINSFVVFPPVLLEIESITDIKAKNNFIADVDDEALEEHPNLELVNLEENPLDAGTHARLSRLEGLRIVITERSLQEWEDLSC